MRARLVLHDNTRYPRRISAARTPPPCGGYLTPTVVVSAAGGLVRRHDVEASRGQLRASSDWTPGRPAALHRYQTLNRFLRRPAAPQWSAMPDPEPSRTPRSKAYRKSVSHWGRPTLNAWCCAELSDDWLQVRPGLQRDSPQLSTAASDTTDVRVVAGLAHDIEELEAVIDQGLC